MTDVISEYQKWKQQGENLKAQAKQAMESRFRELLEEAVSIAEEYRADFGTPLKPPSPVTGFRYRTSPKAKAKKPAKQPAVKAAPRSEPEPQGSDPKMARLQRQLEVTRKKLEVAKAAGKPTRPIEDRIYEIEDALRLSRQPAQRSYLPTSNADRAKCNLPGVGWDRFEFAPATPRAPSATAATQIPNKPARRPLPESAPPGLCAPAVTPHPRLPHAGWGRAVACRLGGTRSQQHADDAAHIRSHDSRPG